jgi:hypothetical protein
MNDLDSLREQRTAIADKAQRRCDTHLSDAETAEFRLLSEQIESRSKPTAAAEIWGSAW